MIYALYYLLVSMVLGGLEVWFTWESSFAATMVVVEEMAGGDAATRIRRRPIRIGLIMWIMASLFWPYTFLWVMPKRLVLWLRGDG